ncbi:MAG: hypothetical protein MR427_10005 [Roseburia sp.]|nr:hypothetical protein [Roseburia sp.]
MDQFIVWMHEYALPVMAGGQALLFIGMLVLIHKINGMRRKADRIISGVEKYLTIVMEEESSQSVQASEKTLSGSTKEPMDEEAQNRLISTVLQEIFP